MKLAALLFSLILFLSLRSSVYAASDITINEFSARGDPDWVEIYNTGSETKSLEGWVIRDSTDSNKISLSGSICSGGTRKFDFSNRLNNAGDDIKLLDSESAVTPQDSLTYFSANIPEHQDNQSTSRNPDGSSSWVVQTTPTPNDNTSCNPQPTPTPNPSPSPSPSPTATPASTSTTTSSSTSSTNPTPTPLKSPSPKPTPKASPSQSPLTLGQTDTQNSDSQPTPTPEPAGEESLSKTKAAAIITGAGAILIALSSGFYLWYSKLLGKEKSQSIEEIEEES